MVSVDALQRLRHQRHGERLTDLKRRVQMLHRERGPADAWVGLFGSLARDDWDGLSDVDLLVIAEQRPDAEALAEALLGASLADDVLGLDRVTWQRRLAASPYWRAIAGEALTLAGSRP
jgi:predicted nucleotidyltransferase